jgi:hypothetical protein
VTEVERNQIDALRQAGIQVSGFLGFGFRVSGFIQIGIGIAIGIDCLTTERRTRKDMVRLLLSRLRATAWSQQERLTRGLRLAASPAPKNNLRAHLWIKKAERSANS